MAILHDLATLRFWRHFLKGCFACFGVLSGVFQFLGIVFPKLTAFQGDATAYGVACISFITGVIWSWPRPITQNYSRPNTRISIVKGDFLKEDGHLVIGVSDTFDVEVPIIAKNSLQGQVLDRLYGGDAKEMHAQLTAALAGKSVIATLTKPGKTAAYGIGTVASVRNSARLLFFLAYTRMNQNNEAHATPDDVWKSLLALWSEVSIRANGTKVSIPVIGGGQARVSAQLPAQDSIRFIALSFMLASREKRLCDELRIVVQEAAYNRLDRLELQSFLSSLRAS